MIPRMIAGSFGIKGYRYRRTRYEKGEIIFVDPDAVLKTKIVEFVERGDFGLASGRKADGTFERSWFQEPVAGDEVAFESGVFLPRNATAEALKAGAPRIKRCG